jgi:Recombinase
MKKVEWIREALTTWPPTEYVTQKQDAGWRLVAVEWEREVQAEAAAPSLEGITAEEIPYGTRIAGDCLHLEDNPTEMQTLNLLAEMVVQDLSYKRMAETLNQHNFRTRDNKPWTALAVFKLTPRLIEVAPRILSGAEWENRKRQLARVSWNS